MLADHSTLDIVLGAIDASELIVIDGRLVYGVPVHELVVFTGQACQRYAWVAQLHYFVEQCSKLFLVVQGLSDLLLRWVGCQLELSLFILHFLEDLG